MEKYTKQRLKNEIQVTKIIQKNIQINLTAIKNKNKEHIPWKILHFIHSYVNFIKIYFLWKYSM